MPVEQDGFARTRPPPRLVALQLPVETTTSAGAAPWDSSCNVCGGGPPGQRRAILLTTTSLADERITTAHRAKLAYVYVRQSSPGQVRHHQESTELQYRLVEQAAVFGWPRERVHVIDDDLGKSGTSSKDRYGFQALIALRSALRKAGLVMSLEQRRGSPATTGIGISSSRRCSAVRGSDCRWPNGYTIRRHTMSRLLLGLSGIMSRSGNCIRIKIRLSIKGNARRRRGVNCDCRFPPG